MFQRLIEIVVAGILKTVEYLDGVLVTGASEEKHQVNLKDVQRRLTEAGLCLKKDTCNFGVDTMEYLGNPIGKDGLKEDESGDPATPTDVTQVISLLDILTCYLQFQPHFATIIQPLHQLLKKGFGFRLGNSPRRAFNEAKELQREALALTHYDVNKLVLLICDISSYGFGVMLVDQVK